MIHQKKMWTACLLAMCLMFARVEGVHGQPRETYIGLRLGGTTGVTFKTFYRSSQAFEGILGTFGNGFSLTGLIEKYQPVYNAEGLRVYYGGGMHLAIYDGRNSTYSYIGHEVEYYNQNDFGLGVNGIIGLEYRLPENVPLAVSLDMKPFLEFGSGGYVVGGMDPSIGVKFFIR